MYNLCQSVRKTAKTDKQKLANVRRFYTLYRANMYWVFIVFIYVAQDVHVFRNIIVFSK